LVNLHIPVVWFKWILFRQKEPKLLPPDTFAGIKVYAFEAGPYPIAGFWSALCQGGKRKGKEDGKDRKEGNREGKRDKDKGKEEGKGGERGKKEKKE